ncbi:MAG: Flp family type IVb pilin [Firmicutes bacterium]|nr:Flp family type IVb pilin [Bacillota bacterium]
MGQILSQLWTDQTGQGMAEYGLLTALIAIAALVAVKTLGETLKEKFQDLNTSLQGVTAK